MCCDGHALPAAINCNLQRDVNGRSCLRCCVESTVAIFTTFRRKEKEHPYVAFNRELSDDRPLIIHVPVRASVISRMFVKLQRYWKSDDVRLRLSKGKPLRKRLKLAGEALAKRQVAKLFPDMSRAGRSTRERFLSKNNTAAPFPYILVRYIRVHTRTQKLTLCEIARQ